MFSFLTKLLERYFSERIVGYNMDEEAKHYTIIAGLPVLGPLLQNVIYNGVLALPVPKEATITGSADVLVTVDDANRSEDGEVVIN